MDNKYVESAAVGGVSSQRQREFSTGNKELPVERASQRFVYADHRSFPNIRVYEITRNEYSARVSAPRNERRIFSTDERKDIAAALIELVTATVCVDYANVWN